MGNSLGNSESFRYVFHMRNKLNKFIQTILTYFHYFRQAIDEIISYYISPIFIVILLKKFALANRKTRIIWASISPGRPPLDQKTIDLIIQLKKLNPKWGALRISLELKKIGIQVSKPTVLKYLEMNGLITPPKSSGLTWSQFMANHKFKISIDFTCLITTLGHQVFIFSIINLDSRELLWINSTYRPNKFWITQQFKNAFFEMEQYPTLCICDRDQMFSNWFSFMMKDYFKINVKKTAYKSPWQNGTIERFNQSLKCEVFESVVPINLNQIQRVCNEYKVYYNENRTHQGINGNIPGVAYKTHPNKTSYFDLKSHLNGLFNTFEYANA